MSKLAPREHASVNGVGWQIEKYHEAVGWIAEHVGFTSYQAAAIALWDVAPDGARRRIYETLETK